MKGERSRDTAKGIRGQAPRVISSMYPSPLRDVGGWWSTALEWAAQCVRAKYYF